MKICSVTSIWEDLEGFLFFSIWDDVAGHRMWKGREGKGVMGAMRLGKCVMDFPTLMHPNTYDGFHPGCY